MSWLPIDQTNELIVFARIADREARSDLAGGYIQSEDDYTSNFTGALRRIINSNSKTGLTATSFLLSSPNERMTGTDAAIIITRQDQSKVALFEAKWPRFSQKQYSWDYAQTATGLSHFSDQLVRQGPWEKRFAVFEMFYCEWAFHQQPAYMHPEASSCVWHADAHHFMQRRTNPDVIWTQDELKAMLRQGFVGIDKILLPFCECQKAEILDIRDLKIIINQFPLPRQVLAVSGDKGRKSEELHRAIEF
jgi:hypothetical protein